MSPRRAQAGRDLVRVVLVTCVVCDGTFPRAPTERRITCGDACAAERQRQHSRVCYAAEDPQARYERRRASRERNPEGVGRNREKNREWHRRERERIRAARPERTCKGCGRTYRADGRQGDYHSKRCHDAARQAAKDALRRAERRAARAQKAIDQARRALDGEV